MESNHAIAMLAALANESRLAIFRELVRTGEDGLSAGVIGERLSLAPSTLSRHLSLLTQASLVQSRRDARHIYFSIRYDRVGAFLDFLVNDCCSGAPEQCGIALPSCGETP